MRNKGKPFRSLPSVNTFWDRLSTIITNKVEKTARKITGTKRTHNTNQIEQNSPNLVAPALISLPSELNFLKLQDSLREIIKKHGGSTTIQDICKLLMKSSDWKTFSAMKTEQLVNDAPSTIDSKVEEGEPSVTETERTELENVQLALKVVWAFLLKIIQTNNGSFENEETATEQDAGKEPPLKRRRSVIDENKGEVEINITTDSGEESLDDSQETIQVSELQQLMKNAILKTGGNSTFESIYKYISKRWSALKHKHDSCYQSTADCRTEVLAALKGGISPGSLTALSSLVSSPEKLKDIANVPILIYAAGVFQRKETTSSEENSEGERGSLSQNQVVWTLKDVPVAVTKTESSTQLKATVSQSDSKETNSANGKLTDMQEMLMKVILSYGGVASFEEIYDSVTKNWKSKRQWSNDSKRALLASLSHNPPGNFKKTKDGLWTVAPKAMLIAEQMTKDDPSMSLKKAKALG